MELWYMRTIRTRLHQLDQWPARALADGTTGRVSLLRHNKLLFCLWFCTLILQSLYIRNNFHLSFFEIGHCIITTLMTIVDCHRITLIWTKAYRDMTKDYIQKIHLFHYKHLSEYSMKIYRQVNIYCRYVSYLLNSQLVACTVLFNLVPFLMNVRSGALVGVFRGAMPANVTLLHSVNYVLPFNCNTQLLGYIAVFILNLFLSYDAGLCFCIVDNYLSLIVFHVWGHLKILDYNLRNFPRPADPSSPMAFLPDELEQVARMLKQNINHHRLIVEFVDKMSTAFGPMLAIYFSFHQVTGCILLLECSTMDMRAVSNYGLLTFIVFQQLMQVSTVFELLGSKSETLAEAVYEVPWECMGARERRLVLVFLRRTQTPVRIKAMGMVAIGVQTMAAILKTSFSYFLMLRTVAFEQ